MIDLIITFAAIGSYSYFRLKKETEQNRINLELCRLKGLEWMYREMKKNFMIYDGLNNIVYANIDDFGL